MVEGIVTQLVHSGCSAILCLQRPLRCASAGPGQHRLLLVSPREKKKSTVITGGPVTGPDRKSVAALGKSATPRRLPTSIWSRTLMAYNGVGMAFVTSDAALQAAGREWVGCAEYLLPMADTVNLLGQ